MTKLDIAGPMSGLPEDNRPAFASAAEALREAGYNVLSPHEINATPGGNKDWLGYMARDLSAIDRFRPDGIALLHNAGLSTGAIVENIVALRMGCRDRRGVSIHRHRARRAELCNSQTPHHRRRA